MPVAVITGGSTGIGRGVALAFAKAGYTVFITGRRLDALKEAANSINKTTGKTSCHFMQCDHSNDAQVEKVFDQIYAEHKFIDVLVNNAYGGVENILGKKLVPFWNKPLDVWDASHTVGFRSHYVASVFVAKRMVPAKKGLIINISSGGGLQYLFDVPYGVGKAALDRLTADMAEELRRHNVAVVSLWPGAVATEKVQEGILNNPECPPQLKASFSDTETTEFSGKCCVALASDSNIMKLSGTVLLTVEVATHHKLTDENGTVPGIPLAKALRQGLSQPPIQWRPPKL